MPVVIRQIPSAPIRNTTLQAAMIEGIDEIRRIFDEGFLTKGELEDVAGSRDARAGAKRSED